MLDHHFEDWRDNDEWRLVLAAYLPIPTGEGHNAPATGNPTATVAAGTAAAGTAAAGAPPPLSPPHAESSAEDDGGSEDDESSSSGWIPRLHSVSGVPSDRLAAIHGKLIAAGYLKFQLAGRSQGVVYRTTPDGRAALNRLPRRDSAPELEPATSHRHEEAA